MDNKWQGLLRRMITGAIFIVLMLTGIYLNRISFMLIFALVAGICLVEFHQLLLVREARRDHIRFLLGVVLGLTPVLFSSLLQLSPDAERERLIAIASLLFFPLVFTAFIYELYTNSKSPFLNVAYMVLGMAYIGFPFSMLDFIAFDGVHFYPHIVMGLLLLSWTNDTGAYLVGSQLGRHKLFPRLSPKKTWEGTLGGGLLTLGVSVLLSQTLGNLTLLQYLILGLIVVVFGNLGDLVESMLKRSVGVKDSGNIMPGHGGLLDRFDAFIFMLPFAAAFLLWIRQAGG